MQQRARRHRSSLQRVFATWMLAWLVALGAPLARVAHAGPEGADVVKGNVKIEKVGDTTVITASDKSIIKFQSFDIGAGETVQFVQPSSKSSVLNKINGAKPTTIEGALLANGRVYLVNRSGVYFAPGAEIHVAEIVAAAGHISNRDFLNGVDRFSDVTGSVRNDGNIHAQAAKLVGATVANSGYISAADAILMVSGDDVLLGKRGSRLYVKIGKKTASEAASPGVEQSGTLEGGRVLLAGGDSLGMAIEHSGTTRAAEIALRGGDTGIVEVSGTLDASDRAAGGTGGRIEVTGERVALRSADLDASGDAGGGEVLVGGDFQGKGRVRTSDVTFVDPDSRIRADAVSDGDGGKVIVWADYTTGFHGEIDARGGAAGGDGGLVETSGQKYLFFHGDVDTSAPQGEMGRLLLDPVDIVIANGTGDGGSDGTNTYAGDPSGVTGSVNFADTAPTTVYESELEGLAATTNVLLQASNSIVMQNLADDVLGLSTQTGGSVAFTGTGSFSMDAGDTIRTEGASISISGGSVALGNLSTRGASGLVAGGAVNLTTTGPSSLTIRSINAGAGNVGMNVGGSILDDGNTATRITANNLQILALASGASIGGSALAPLGTNLAGNFSAGAPTGSGGIFLSEFDGLLLGNVSGGTTKPIGLTAEAGAITQLANTVVSGSTATVTTQAAGVALGTAGVPFRTNLTGALNATTSNANIFLSSAFTGGVANAKAMTVGEIIAGTGNVTLNGTTGVGVTALQGSILGDGVPSTRIHAAGLTLNAATAGASIGSLASPIQTNLTGTLAATSASGAGNLVVSELSGLVVGAISAAPKNVTLTAESGSISATGATIGANNLSLIADGAGAGIGTGATPVPTVLAGVLNASTANGTGGIFITDVGPQGDLMSIGAINGGNGSVQLVSQSGSIVDDGNASTFISGDGLTLRATFALTTPNPFASVIGTSTAPIVTQDVGTLSAFASGSIFVRQTQGDLALGDLSSTGVPGILPPPQSAVRAGVSGGITIQNDAGVLLVNGPVTTFAGTLINPANGLPPNNLAYTLPGDLTLDSPGGIEFGASSLTVNGSILLNTNVATPGTPTLATIFRRPGAGDTAADLTLTSNRGFIEVGEGQVVSVPGHLTFNAETGSPGGGLNNAFPFVFGSVTVGDVNAMGIEVNAQRGTLLLRGARSLYQRDGTVLTDGGVDWVANTIEITTDLGFQTSGSGGPVIFSTPDGGVIDNAPPGTRFGTPEVAMPLTPASFVGASVPEVPVNTPASGRLLDFAGSASSVRSSPDAVAPYPSPIVRDDGQLERFNEEAAALNPVWGMALLAYLRCSAAPGEDPDAVPIACLGYDPQQQARAPLSGPEAAAARADYRELLAVRDELRTDLHQAFDAYRAQAQGAEPNGADFRRFVEEDPARGEASNALQSLRSLLDSLDAMLGPERASGSFESWQRDLLLDFTPGNMTPELLYEATGAGTSRVQTAGL